MATGAYIVIKSNIGSTESVGNKMFEGGNSIVLLLFMFGVDCEINQFRHVRLLMLGRVAVYSSGLGPNV